MSTGSSPLCGERHGASVSRRARQRAARTSADNLIQKLLAQITALESTVTVLVDRLAVALHSSDPAVADRAPYINATLSYVAKGERPPHAMVLQRNVAAHVKSDLLGGRPVQALSPAELRRVQRGQQLPLGDKASDATPLRGQQPAPAEALGASGPAQALVAFKHTDAEQYNGEPGACGSFPARKDPEQDTGEIKRGTNLIRYLGADQSELTLTLDDEAPDTITSVMAEIQDRNSIVQKAPQQQAPKTLDMCPMHSANVPPVPSAGFCGVRRQQAWRHRP